ncbi:hypothetical protein AB4851_29980 [Burkholderia sp. 22PA0099]|uniref:hypothetical protein n=1 Tax=Burkholderia sp. 22PA0099 TaxID=3237372 RepID=UPI0039C3CEC0
MPSARFDIRRSLAPAIAAGAIAILINVALLAIADKYGLVTARGGLLTLLNRTLHIPGNGLARNWLFQQAFHIAVGIGMAIFYAGINTRPAARPILKSLLYAAAPWLANSLIILPLIGQGIAGSRVISVPGMIYFAFAHTAFFVINGLLLARFSAE